MSVAIQARHARRPPDEPAIETRGLRKTYRTRKGRSVAVAGLDLRVVAGGVHGFLGPNGSGKTTTIRMLLGLVTADAGTVRVFGAEVPRQLPQVIARIGAIVEQPRFFGNFSGDKNLSLLARAIGAPQRRVGEVLEEVGLADRGKDRFRTYSLGMKQRLAIAATLLKSPDLLIFDEPTNGLDPAGIQEIRATMRGLADQGRTVLVSSHILSEVQQVADTVSIIGRGRLLAEGTVTEILNRGGRATVRVAVADPGRAAEVLGAAGYRVSPTEDGRLSVDPGVSRRAAGGGGGHSRPRRGGALRGRAHPGPRRPGVGVLAADGRRTAGGRDVALATTSGVVPGGAPVTRLLRAELNRLCSRRFTVVALVVVLLAISATMIGVNSALRPPSAAEVALGQRQYAQALKEAAQAEADCRKQAQKPEECDFRPQLSNYVRQPTPFRVIGIITATFATFFVGIALLFVGASFIGAEYSSGSIGNWLSFVPMRWQVLTAKLLALAGGAALAGAVANAYGLGITRLLAAVHSQPARGAGDVVATGVRGTALVVVFAVFGFAVALLTRHTAAAAGVVLAYLVVRFVLTLLMGQVERLQGILRWLPENNVLAVLQHGHRYQTYRTVVTTDAGVSQESATHVLSAGHGVVYLAVLMLLALGLSYAAFLRRDVN